MERLLHVAFNSSSPLQQVIIFGFNKLLQWTPREIVAGLSGFPIRDLEASLEQKLVETRGYSQKGITDCFQKLRRNMDAVFGTLVQHPKTRELHKALLHRITGDIVLREFYSSEQEAEGNVDQWVNNVWKDVRVKMLEDDLSPSP